MHPDSELHVRPTIIGPAITAVARQGLAWLEQASGERRYVQSELRIGRGEQNDLRLNDASVSRYHAFLRRVDGRYLLSDVGSQNGTFINGRQVHAPSPLQSGDRIRAGTTELIFHLDMPVEPALNADDHSTTITGATSTTSFTTITGSSALDYVQGDLRIVTVLFLDLHGFTALSETMPPDEVTQMMNRCFERLTATVARFGGYVDKYVGDAMMVLFGAPVAHADDPERAVRAALALQEELARFNQRQSRRSNLNLQMRVGINTGEVLAGRVGAAQYGQYTVMGDAVNLASRLEHAARVGHVLVGESTHRLTREIFSYAALPPLAIRGKSEPVQTFEVVAPHSLATSPGVAFDSSFVGRNKELTLLGDLIARSAGGFQSAAVIAEASLGKSSLLMEFFRQHATDARWAMARCTEYDRGTPYLALRQLTLQILRSTGRAADLLRSSSDTANAQLTALAQLLSPNVEPTSAGTAEARRHALASAFTQLLTEHALRESLVLVIDGIQWIDSESLAVLDAVVPDLEDLRVVLITSARPDWRHAWPNEVLTLRLERFSRQECAQLVSFLLRTSTIAADSLDILVRESDGNPLLLSEMVRSAVESGRLCEQDGQWRLLRPDVTVTGAGADSLRSIVQARLDQLSPDERRVLQVAAVLGQNWTASLLARVIEDNLPVQDLLRDLAEREYLIQEMGGEEPGYSFAHAITQEVAYASLPHAARERLHERAGRILEDQFDPVRPNKVILRQLVHHFMHGSSRDRAAQYLLHAADAGAGIADDTWAIETYRRAFEYAQKTRDRMRRRALEFEIQEHLGDALLRQSNIAEAQVAFEAAGDIEESGERGLRLRLKLAHVASRQGNHARVLTLARLLPATSDAYPLITAALECRAALSLCSMGQLREAGERVSRAMSLRESDQAPPDLALAALGALHRLRGELTQARVVLEQGARDHADAIDSEGSNDLRIELARTYYASGVVDEAMRLIDATPRRDSWVYVSCEILRGRLLLDQGSTDQALGHFEDALERAQRIGAREEVLVARMCVAHVALAVGQPAEAGELARAVASSAEALKLRPLVCEAQAVLSAALLRGGDSAQAAEVAREAVVRARSLRLPLHEAVCRRALGLALVEGDDPAQGRKHLESAAAVLEQAARRSGV